MERPREALQAALVEAMKKQDVMRRTVIRMTLNAIKQVEVDTRREVGDEEVLDILQKEAKKRRESIADLEKAGRAEAIAEEQAALHILEEFLPRQLGRAEVEALAQEAIRQAGATSPKDKGKVMALLMPKVKGQADGRLVNEVVQSLLGS